MLAALIEFSLRQRLLVIMGALLLLSAGIWSALHLPIDAVPDITNTQVQVNTSVNALAPEEIEKLITFPLEQQLRGIQGVEEFRSITKSGLSQITLVFHDGTDVYRARQLVSERLANAELPDGVHPEMSPVSTGLGEILYYTLDYKSGTPQRQRPRKEQLMELRDVHDYVVKPFMLSIPGVAEINSSGGYDRQIVIEPRPDALMNAGLTFDELAEAVAHNLDNTGGGIIERGEERILLRGVGRVENKEAISQLPVKFAAGVEPLKVGDLAEVVIGSATRTGAATEDGEEAVLGTVMMLVGENSRTIALRVEEKLKQLQEKLPPDMETRIQYTRSAVVDRTIETVEKNLSEGAILVVVVLLLLLGNWRAAIIVALAIPLAFVFAILGMARFGVSGNLMSLGAVDFGLIIDGAVVMVENIVRVLGHRQAELGRPLNLRERTDAVRDAAQQVASPMFYGVLIIAIVYIPILALSGVEGKMFHPMAITVMLALGGALVLALTLMPTLCSLLLFGNVSEKENFLMHGVKTFYRRILGLAWSTRYGVIAGAIIVCAASVWGARKLPQEFVPTLNEGSWTAMVYQPASTNLTTSLNRCLATQKVLLADFPEVTRTFARIGTSEVATDPMAPGEYDLYIFYKDPKEWRQENGKPVSRDRLEEIVRETLDQKVGGQNFDFAQPIQMRFNEMLEGSRADLSVKIFGENFDEMERAAEEVKSALESQSGANEVAFESEGRVPVLEIRLDHGAMARLNVDAEEANATIHSTLAGYECGILLEHDRRRDIVVRLPEELRRDENVILNLPVRTRDGALITLGKVAKLETTAQVDVIGRENARRRIAINVDLLPGTDAERFVAGAKARLLEMKTLPESISVDFGGQFEHLQEARQRLTIIVPVALVVIFVLILTLFQSVKQSLVVYTGIPLAMTGGVAALWLREMPFSISAAVGFIALCGVAVLNGVMLISYFNQLRNEGFSVVDAVREGAVTRLRPVLMTALVASLGFIPMAIGTGAGAEVQRPLATVVIGGILSSTFLTLVLLPVLYRMVEARGQASKKSTVESEKARIATASGTC